MPWCPKCRSEYREGFTKCNDCKVDLVDELGPEKPDAKAIISELDSEEYLMTVDNEIQANIIEGLLNSYKIPVLKKYREAGEYLKVVMGNTNYGVDIYVPSSLAGTAKRIIDESARAVGEDAVFDDDESGNRIEAKEIRPEGYSEDKGIIKTWMIILFLLIPILIWIFISFNK